MQTDQKYERPSFQAESRLAGLSLRVPDIFPSSPSVDELDTLPLEVRKMARMTPESARNVQMEQWQDYPFLVSNPLERIRWWLLYPKRIEFLLWASGTFLLVCATIVFVFILTLSLNTPDKGSSSAGKKPAATTSVMVMPPLSSSANISTPTATLPVASTGQESDTHVTGFTLQQISLSLNNWQWSFAIAGYGLSLLLLGLACLLYRSRRK